MFSQKSNNILSKQDRPRRAFTDVTNSTTNRNGKSKDDQQPLAKKRNVPVILKRQKSGLPSSFTQKDQAKLQSQIENNLSISNKGTEDKESAVAKNADKSKNKANKDSYQFTGQLDDIDKRDHDDPLCVTSYVQEMYDHFRTKESSTSVKPTFMERQPHINERMRSILIDWLVEVHQKFKLVPETLYLTVNLIDRYLEKENISRPKLQLLGVTSLLIASKYEEIYPPEISDLIYICDRAYNKKQIIGMEEKILKTLSYQITIPSAHAFLVRFLKAAHADRKMVQLSCYILDGTLQSYTLLHYLPSQLAAAAVLIARKVVGRNAWSPTLLKYATYCEEEILPVARAIVAEKSSSSSDFSGVDKKYSSSRYGGIARTQIEIDL